MCREISVTVGVEGKKSHMHRNADTDNSALIHVSKIDFLNWTVHTRLRYLVINLDKRWRLQEGFQSVNNYLGKRNVKYIMNFLCCHSE